MGTPRFDHRNGARVYWQKHRRRLLDALGHDVIKFLTDFERLPVDDTTGDPTEWTVSVVEVGGTSTLAQADGSGGFAQITTAGNEDDGVNAQLNGESFRLKSTNILYFGAFGVLLSEATQSDLFLGLAITDVDILGGVTHRIGFEKLDGVTALKFPVEKATVETLLDLSVAVGATPLDLEFYWDGSKVEVFVNGVSKGKPASTNIPSDEALRISWQFLAGAAGAKNCKIDAIRCIQIGR